MKAALYRAHCMHREAHWKYERRLDELPVADDKATSQHESAADERIGDLAFVKRTSLMSRGLASSMPLRVE
jgi:hypothetical protein